MPKNKTLKQIVGENVKAIMTTKGLSQPKVAAIAKKAGTPLNQTTVGRIANASFPATLDTLEALASGLGVAPWLFLLPYTSDKNFLVLLEAWEQSGEQGKRLLLLAAKGALERDSFEWAAGGATDVAQSRRSRPG